MAHHRGHRGLIAIRRWGQIPAPLLLYIYVLYSSPLHSSFRSAHEDWSLASTVPHTNLVQVSTHDSLLHSPKFCFFFGFDTIQLTEIFIARQKRRMKIMNLLRKGRVDENNQQKDRSDWEVAHPTHCDRTIWLDRLLKQQQQPQELPKRQQELLYRRKWRTLTWICSKMAG